MSRYLPLVVLPPMAAILEYATRKSKLPSQKSRDMQEYALFQEMLLKVLLRMKRCGRSSIILSHVRDNPFASRLKELFISAGKEYNFEVRVQIPQNSRTMPTQLNRLYCDNKGKIHLK